MRCDRGTHDGSFLALLHRRCYAAPAMDLSKKKFGMLLSTGPEHATNLDAAVGLSEAARARGAFLPPHRMHAGGRAPDDAGGRAVPGRGANFFVGRNAAKRGRT